ncbi:hypothetical protein SH139x_004814 [Planctomycetaceae bacterium SH139]
MSDWIFTARERFTPDDSAAWAKYIAWIGFTAATEIVTLDHVLCPELIDSPTDSDWPHNVQEDYRTTWFHDLAYLRKRCNWRIGQNQIIAMIDAPETELPPPSGFTHCGFDILDGYDSISVLTNCGPFPGLIDPKSVNSFGLLSSLQVAQSIADKMRIDFPDDPHCCDCVVWQIAQDTDPGK